jgi:hypothetical protein
VAIKGIGVFKKVDSNQTRVVKALRELGATVQHLHSVGKGCPDLLVGYKSVNVLLEIKRDETKKLTPDQVIWHHNWRGQVATVATAQQAYDVVIEQVKRFRL